MIKKQIHKILNEVLLSWKDTDLSVSKDNIINSEEIKDKIYRVRIPSDKELKKYDELQSRYNFPNFWECYARSPEASHYIVSAPELPENLGSYLLWYIERYPELFEHPVWDNKDTEKFKNFLEDLTGLIWEVDLYAPRASHGYINYIRLYNDLYRYCLEINFPIYGAKN